MGTVAPVTGTEITRLTADVEVKSLTVHTMIPIPERFVEFNGAEHYLAEESPDILVWEVTVFFG